MPDVRSLVRQNDIPTIVVRPPGRGGTQAQPLQPGVTSDLPPGWASPTLAQPQQPTVASDLPAGWGGPGQTQAQPQRAAVGSDLPPGWGGPTPEVTGASPPAKPPPVDTQPANSGSQPASTQSGGSGTQTPTQTPNGANPSAGDDFRTQVDKQVQPNCLNGLYQPTYHFRLFIASELDLAEATSTSDIGSLMSNLQKIKQVIIAESGVTGYTIREVEINTIATQNAATRDQKATTFTVTVTEPMGISFLDALANAAGYLGIKDWTKVSYYLQLSFTGYKEDGTFAGNPVFTGFKNGGQWLWGLTITTIDTKVNEGGGVYTISMVTSETESVLIESKKFTSPKTAITAEGSTLGELFDDYVKKLNQSWSDNFKPEKQTDSPLYEYHIITHPVTFGTYNGRDPKNFKLQPQKKDTSPIRWQAMDSKQKWTAHIGPETSVNDFIISAIKATEEGQELFKNESVKDNIDQTETSTNSQHFRVSTAFSIEPLVSYKRMDGNSGNYTKKVDIHVTPYSTQGIIASRTQVKDAEDPAVQREMINDLVKKGLLKKRYDYIFTGLNTEIIDFDIKFNMAWQAVLAKLAGKRIGYASEAIAARITTDGTSRTTQPQDDASLVKENKVSTVSLTGQPNNSSEGTQPTAPQPAPGMALSTAQQALEPVGNLGLVRDPATGRIFTPGGGGLAMAPSPTGPTQPNDSMVQYPALTDAMSRIRASVAAAENAPGWAGKFLTDKFSQSTGQPSKPAQPAAPESNVLYMEDIVSRMAQGQKLNRSILPISFTYGYHNTEAASGSGLAGQDHRGMSVMGMAVQLFSTPDITGAFQQVELNIRGDPFFLGQSNYERRFALMAGKTLDPGDIPDYSSARPCIQLYFKYPLTIGDDFKPVLHDSECFNGIYEVTVVKHTFSEGSFKQTLTAIRYPLITPSVAFSNNPGSTANSNSGSSANSDAVPGSNKPGSGNTPGGGTSNPGDTKGFSNKNPMNLQYVDGQPGVTGQDGRFGQYATMEDGIAASMNQLLINQNQHNLTTIATQIADPVHGWTPAKDNSVALTNGSINGLSQSLGISPTDPLDLSNPATAQKFIDTKIKQENSRSVDSSVIAAGVAKGIAYYNSRHH